mmetsp:Transcript_40551/g.111599  ORF Transcript_40551/g.111599 Transcript_40551/m.111599 type:complete len:211 (+) Transcript_40551:123-755(+)
MHTRLERLALRATGNLLHCRPPADTGVAEEAAQGRGPAEGGRATRGAVRSGRRRLHINPGESWHPSRSFRTAAAKPPRRCRAWPRFQMVIRRAAATWTWRDPRRFCDEERRAERANLWRHGAVGGRPTASRAAMRSSEAAAASCGPAVSAGNRGSGCSKSFITTAWVADDPLHDLGRPVKVVHVGCGGAGPRTRHDDAHPVVNGGGTRNG